MIEKNLKQDAQNTLKTIQKDLDLLRESFTDKQKFYDILNIIHGRFSKIELILLDLEKLNA